ncbi:MerR family DNA-binding transcriptional regulator [Rhodococcus sp. OK302]|uniref:MerR family DNA-binding transcriptional regulator n=1 Tax=Rhodococcus sp. OK302 TaxID=1882769 RepID=UPI000B94299B|nr:MerR family DNA-binding transcriptional regulator [Rhodococcus sp. OK302]OYD61350.1 DNA-binding transcriptional MerR regulator [Rhodococcus sp. OK302]
MSSRKNLKAWSRPANLARAHGLSTQAIRNYEAEGILPAAARTPTGHRRFTLVHRLALDAFVALVAATGRPSAVRILRACNANDLDVALEELDHVHAQLLADRLTVRTLNTSIEAVAEVSPPQRASLAPVELARRLGLTTTTLRDWEAAGILTPARVSGTRHRIYGPQDVRDAELAHLLRRGGQGLTEIASVIGAVRDNGGTIELMETIADWKTHLSRRGGALLAASNALAQYLGGRDAESAAERRL